MTRPPILSVTVIARLAAARARRTLRPALGISPNTRGRAVMRGPPRRQSRMNNPNIFLQETQNMGIELFNQRHSDKLM